MRRTSLILERASEGHELLAGFVECIILVARVDLGDKFYRYAVAGAARAVKDRIGEYGQGGGCTYGNNPYAVFWGTVSKS